MLVPQISACFIPIAVFFIAFRIFVPQMRAGAEFCSLLLGLLCVLPIALLQVLLGRLSIFSAESMAGILLNAMVFSGLAEEAAKMLLVLLLPSRKMKLAQYFACALLLGISLACFENVIYICAGTARLLPRTFTSVPLHSLCAGLCGLCAWSGRRKSLRLLPFAYAAAVHGLYDFFAAFPDLRLFGLLPLRIFSVMAILFGVIEARVWYKDLRQLEAESGLEAHRAE